MSLIKTTKSETSQKGIQQYLQCIVPEVDKNLETCLKDNAIHKSTEIIEEPRENTAQQKSKVADTINQNLNVSKAAEDIKSVEDTKSVKDTKVVKEVKIVESIKVVKDVKSVEDTKSVEDIKSVEDTKVVEDIKSVEDTKAVKDIKSVEDAKTARDTKSVEDTKSIEATPPAGPKKACQTSESNVEINQSNKVSLSQEPSTQNTKCPTPKQRKKSSKKAKPADKSELGAGITSASAQAIEIIRKNQNAGTYRNYTKDQIENMLEKISEGWFIKHAAIECGIPPSTAYLIYKRHKDAKKEESVKDPESRLLVDHTVFLIDLFKKMPGITLHECHARLVGQFEGLKITYSALYRHLMSKCHIRLKNSKSNMKWVPIE